MLRILLAEDLGYFGAGDFDDRLDAAYKHFVAYCRSRHISHSQPPFTPKMVTWRIHYVMSYFFVCFRFTYQKFGFLQTHRGLY